MKVGAICGKDGVFYRIWAPKARKVDVEITSREGVTRRLELKNRGRGYFEGHDPDGRAGDAYGFCLGGPVLPDPASRAQADDVHGKSLVVDPGAYVWRDAGWRRPDFRDVVIYELHVGTFTEEGTFRSAIKRLPHLRKLGVTAVEIMPVADFPGSRNWGYDGVLIYAPARVYGSPDDFRALVEAAHREGLAVILDVVYNHLGPDGNCLGAYGSQYFCRRHHTPWGDGFNFDDEDHEAVREFFLGNPVYWMEEFHIDGFRFDATHEIADDSPCHILAEMTAAVRARGGYAIAEDSRNDVRVLDENGLHFHGVWADDFHHAVRVSQTRERQAYFQDFRGTLSELIECLDHGWLYRGQPSPSQGRPRGTDPKKFPPSCFVHCLSNHDQTGNRALGERIGANIEPAAYRALSLLLCLSPYTPMLFMGQEWGAASPFLFFCDHHSDLGRAVTEGRRREFACFPEFSDPAGRARIPDPQAEETFRRSKLRWDETDRPPHAGLLALYREGLHLRQRESAFRPVDRTSWSVRMQDEIGILSFDSPTPIRGGRHEESAGCRSADYLLLFVLHPGASGERPAGDYELLLSSEESRFGGSGTSAWSGSGRLQFPVQEAILLRRKSD
jgi:malto-oligosyltrehalose trehalohydrolase